MLFIGERLIEQANVLSDQWTRAHEARTSPPKPSDRYEPVPPEHPDRTLLEALRERARMTGAFPDEAADPEGFKRHEERYSALGTLITQTPARTYEGLLGKVCWQADMEIHDGGAGVSVMDSIFRDLPNFIGPEYREPRES